MKRIWFWFAGCLLAIPLVLCVWGFVLPPQYRETFLGELSVKCERLAEPSDKPRLVLVGGSAAAFGVDSALLEEQLPQDRVVNFGMYAALGTRVMLDLSEPLLQEGDLVLVMPEQQQQTLSDYLGAQALWQAADGNFSLLRCLHGQDAAQMLGAFPQFAAQKFRFWCSGGPQLSGVYQRSSFNEAGDIINPLCRANQMPNGWDTTTPIRFDAELLDETFCTELNAYAARLAEKGVTVWYHFPPMNAAAVEPDSDVDAYAALLQNALTLPLAGDPNACILDSGWFYDTNFHLNASGKTVFTRQLVRDIKAMLGDSSPTEIALPEMPEPVLGETTATALDSTDADCFTFAQTASGLRLTGLTSEGQQRTELTVPGTIDGQPVTELSAEMFAQSRALRKVTIQENISALPDGLFEGCTSLQEVVLIQPDPGKLAVGRELLRGAVASCQLSVPADSYERYVLSYAWSSYAPQLKKQ